MSARCMETSLNANAAAKLNTATETLLRTASGRQLYAKYNDSKTHDIYITVADFGEDSKHAGITIPNADGSDAKEIVPPGSPAGKMVKQLETLKKKEQKK